MAQITQDWLKVDKDSGSGNETLNLTALQAHTGRLPRTIVMTGTTDSDAEATANVTQQGKTEFVTFDQAIWNVANSATTCVLTGKSNSSKLTFSKQILEQSTFDVTITSTYQTVDGDNVQHNETNGQALSSDYGAEAEYTFSVTLTFQANPTAESRSRNIVATTNSGATNTAQLVQAGQSSYILFNGHQEASVTIGNTVGSQITVDLDSNDTWTLELNEV